MVYIGWVFAVLCSVVFPVLLSIFLAKRAENVKGVLLGAACFTLTQILLRLPMLSVMSLWADYVVFQSVYPILNLAFLSFSAGLFEEIGRFVFMKFFMKSSKTADAIAFGAGHGSVEAVLLVGLSQFALVLLTGGSLAGYSASEFFLSGAERVFAICTHIGLSLIIWSGIKRRMSGLFVPLCVVLHGVFNFTASYLQFLGVNMYIVEGVIAFAGVSLLISGLVLCRDKKS